MIEVVLFMWVFGADNAWKEMNQGGDIRIPRPFYYIMKYVTPVYIGVLLCFWFFQDGIDVFLMRNVPEQNFPYIWFARFLLVSMLVAVLIMVRIAWQRKHVIQQRIPPS